MLRQRIDGIQTLEANQLWMGRIAEAVDLKSG